MKPSLLSNSQPYLLDVSSATITGANATGAKTIFEKILMNSKSLCPITYSIVTEIETISESA